MVQIKAVEMLLEITSIFYEKKRNKKQKTEHTSKTLTLYFSDGFSNFRLQQISN